MNISEKTKEVLKNFSTINAAFVLSPGKVQRTISQDDLIYAEAIVPDEFVSEFGIYDLPGFLSNLSLLNAPELEFQGTSVNIKDDNFTVSYRGCDKSIIHYPPEGFKGLSVEDPDITFNLSIADLQKLLKVASTNTFPHMVLYGKNGKLAIKVVDLKNDTSNSGEMLLDVDVPNVNFECAFKVENLKILPMNYVVKIKDTFAQFENSDGTLKYLICLESLKKGKK